MKIELTQAECQNVTVALISLSKTPNAVIEAMKTLLILSDKFIWKEEVKEEVKKELAVSK